MRRVSIRTIDDLPPSGISMPVTDLTADAGGVSRGVYSAHLGLRPCHQRNLVLETCRLQVRPVRQLPTPAEAAIDCPLQQYPRRLDVVWAKLFAPRRFSIAVKGRMQEHLQVRRSANNRIAGLGRQGPQIRLKQE